MLSLQLQSKMRKAVLLHGNIVFIALEHFNIFGFSDNIQKILRDTRVFVVVVVVVVIVMVMVMVMVTGLWGRSLYLKSKSTVSQ